MCSCDLLMDWLDDMEYKFSWALKMERKWQVATRMF